MTVIYPRWTNKVPGMIVGAILLGGVFATFAVWYWFSPWYTDVGFAPKQPVFYSHKLHAGLLGMDCRYCHRMVMDGPAATVPDTQTCMNCHAQVLTDSPRLEPVRESFRTGQPIEWVRVHMLPDYAHFPHNAHTNAGIGCVSCHGRCDELEIMRLEQPLSMSWCLDCHRAPENHLRPVSEVTNMSYEHDMEVALKIKAEKNINPPTTCSACHR